MIDTENLEATLHQYGIPPGMWPGIRRYLIERIRPGSFLQAIFANSFVDAMAQADDDNRQILREYASLLYNELPARGPASPWGSPEAVEAWVAASEITTSGRNDEHTGI